MSGLEVFPCREVPGPSGQVVKASYVEGQHEVATRNQAQIEAWWTAHPNALIGYSTGKSNVIVLDIDLKKGKDGYAALEAAGLVIPDTFSYATPSGGRHYVYASTRSKMLKPQQNYLGMIGVDRQSGKSHAVFYADQAPWP